MLFDLAGLLARFALNTFPSMSNGFIDSGIEVSRSMVNNWSHSPFTPYSYGDSVGFSPTSLLIRFNYYILGRITTIIFRCVTHFGAMNFTEHAVLQ